MNAIRHLKLAALATLALTGASLVSLAHDYDIGDLHVAHPWAQESLGSITAGAVYFTIENRGAADDSLIGAEATVAAATEIHGTEEDNGVKRMHRAEKVDIPAGASVAFAPRGPHIALIDLVEPLNVGDSFPLILSFEKAGQISVTVKVEEVGGGTPHAH